MDNVYHSRTPPYYFGVDIVSASGAPNLDDTLNLNITVHMTLAVFPVACYTLALSFVDY